MIRIIFLIITVVLISNFSSWSQTSDGRLAYSGCYGNINPEGVPKFPGGASAKAQFIADNLYYPTYPLREKIQGTVVIGFTVEEDGTLTDFRILKGVYASLDGEALRLAESMPNWIPAKLSGIPIRKVHEINITFKLPCEN
jgi:TonB family protein